MTWVVSYVDRAAGKDIGEQAWATKALADRYAARLEKIGYVVIGIKPSRGKK